ncbi:MAG: diguanylate cyclase [Campylobacterota bacterium]|nr:diguanylate cyclase [Campylobacterota bacterium]
MNKELLKKVNVLYVEDEDSVRDFTGKTIGSIVKKITTANNGKEGLDKFIAAYDTVDSFDLIVTDINMPKMGGLAMVQEIKKLDKDILVIITSAHNDPAFLKKSIDIGITSYILKPIDLYQLIEEMTKTLEPMMFKKQLLQSNKELEESNTQLKSNAQQSKDQLHSLFDSQDSLILSGNGDKAEYCNDKFLDFFGLKDVEHFIKEYKCICNIMSTSKSLMYEGEQTKDLNWIEYLLKIPQEDRIVELKNKKNEYKSFQIHINTYNFEGLHYVVSFTDITNLKEKSKLYEYQESHDQLTDLYNHQKFEKLFTKEIKRTQRYNHNLTLILLNIDDFKNFTQKPGLGDKVLIHVAQLLNKTLRDQDIIARPGGDDFEILVPETSKENALIVANKLKQAIEDSTPSFLNTKITASFGLAYYDGGIEIDALIEKAKKALKFSKTNGKNCINMQD